MARRLRGITWMPHADRREKKLKKKNRPMPHVPHVAEHVTPCYTRVCYNARVEKKVEKKKNRPMRPMQPRAPIGLQG